MFIVVGVLLSLLVVNLGSNMIHTTKRATVILVPTRVTLTILISFVGKGRGGLNIMVSNKMNHHTVRVLHSLAICSKNFEIIEYTSMNILLVC